MTSFSTAVQTASLLSLVSLLGYTLWLMRAGRLSAHVTVRWVLAETAAILGVVLWSWLPLFSVTSGLDDRELLVILVVVLFVFVVFLMLDSLARISAHTDQIKRLTQEVAILRTAVGGPAGTGVSMLPIRSEDAPQDPGGGADRPRPSPSPMTWAQLVAVTWISGCIALFVLEMRPDLLITLKAGLTAGYLE